MNYISQKQNIVEAIKQQKQNLIDMSQFIFNNPEVGFQEVKASELLVDYLKKNGFEVEMGYGNLPTAFRAIYQHGCNGPHIGLLCEYDALKDMGHACAHHLQGPSIVGAAVAIKNTVHDVPYILEVIGTPGEECSNGGKNIMLKNGAFMDLDVALMMHASDSTTTDIRSLASFKINVIYKGVAAHAALAPEKGRSALDALLLAFNGISFLRGHIQDDVRINGIITEGGQVTNIITDQAEGSFEIRSYNEQYLQHVIEQVKHIFQGAALMTDTTYELNEIGRCRAKVPVLTLNNLLMENAKLVKAVNITPPREKTGSTDFASVMFHVPGCCIRVAFVDRGTSSHSKAWLDKGLSKDAQTAMLTGSQILAFTVRDLIVNKEKLQEIKDEFASKKS